jgi:probable DNA metabolism protein
VRVLRIDGSFEEWRGLARDLLAHGVPPEEVSFTEEEQLGLFASEAAQQPWGRTARSSLRVPAAFLSMAQMVACHREPSRWDRLYRVLWRAAIAGGNTLLDPSDEDVLELERMAGAVRKDLDRVRALVRFRRVELDGIDEWYVAFHRPQHHTLPLAAPFFARRFAPMCWSILTPDSSAHWNRRTLSFTPGVPQDLGLNDDAEVLWRAYYATTFNPARVNERLLRTLLPRRHWDTLPEGRDIAALVRRAGPRVAAMTTAPGRPDESRLP